MTEIIKSHKDLDIWKRSRRLAKDIYILTNKLPKSEEVGLKSQMRRAVISVPSNIAEGAARKGTKEFIHFLYIALASLSELETQLLLCEDLGLITELTEHLNKIVILRKQLSATISSLQRKLNNK